MRPTTAEAGKTIGQLLSEWRPFRTTVAEKLPGVVAALQRGTLSAFGRFNSIKAEHEPIPAALWGGITIDIDQNTAGAGDGGRYFDLTIVETLHCDALAPLLAGATLGGVMREHVLLANDCLPRIADYFDLDARAWALFMSSAGRAGFVCPFSSDFEKVHHHIATHDALRLRRLLIDPFDKCKFGRPLYTDIAEGEGLAVIHARAARHLSRLFRLLESGALELSATSPINGERISVGWQIAAREGACFDGGHDVIRAADGRPLWFDPAVALPPPVMADSPSALRNKGGRPPERDILALAREALDKATMAGTRYTSQAQLFRAMAEIETGYKLSPAEQEDPSRAPARHRSDAERASRVANTIERAVKVWKSSGRAEFAEWQRIVAVIAANGGGAR